MTEAETAKALQAAQEIVRLARKQYFASLQKLYPKTAYVRWKEGPYVRAGNVVGYSLSGYSLRCATSHGVKEVTPEAILKLHEEENSL